MNKKILRNIVLAVFIIIGGFMVMNILSGMAKKVEIQEDRSAPRVKVFEANPDTVDLSLNLYGKLNAVNRVDLLAEVSGTYQGGTRSFLEGTFFKKGEVLLQLDNAEAEANMKSLKGNYINSILGILPDIKMDYPLDYDRFHSYYESLSLSSTLPVLPEAAGTLEKFLIARGIQSAYFQVKGAEERLAKFSIRAPFNGVVAVANVKLGNVVSPGRVLGTYVGRDSYELKSAITLSYADELQVGQKVRFTSPDVAGTWTGTIDRISPVVDVASQSINVIANVRGNELREGMYLTGAIEGVQVFDALPLPAYMVFDNEYVYTVESDSILQKTKIQVLEWLDDQIIITGIDKGAILIDSPTLSATAGTIVNTFQGEQ